MLLGIPALTASNNEPSQTSGQQQMRQNTCKQIIMKHCIVLR
jgi:hypothetical protein